MGRTLGRVLRQFREASNGFTEVVQTNIMDPASEELEKSPKQRKREAEAQNVTSEVAAGGEASAGDEPAPKRETFAERKARLMAERKAAEEAAAAEAQQSEDQAKNQAEPILANNVDASEEVSATGDSVDSGDAAKSNSAEGSLRTSAADLYAVSSQKSTRMQAKDAAQQKTVESTSGEEDGDA